MALFQTFIYVLIIVQDSFSQNFDQEPLLTTVVFVIFSSIDTNKILTTILSRLAQPKALFANFNNFVHFEGGDNS